MRKSMGMATVVWLSVLLSVLLSTGLCSSAWADFPVYLDGSSLPGGGWAPDGGGGSAAIVPLGGGNSGIQYTDTGGGYFEHYWTHGDQSATFAARFSVDSFDAGTPHNLMLLTVANASDTSPGLVFGIRGGQYFFGKFFPSPDEGSLLSNIAPVVPGAFNEVAVYLDSATDTATLWWNGSPLFSQSGVAGSWGDSSTGYAEVGSAGWNPDDSGAMVVTYDWIGYGPGLIPEPSTLSLLALTGILALRRRRAGR